MNARTNNNGGASGSGNSWDDSASEYGWDRYTVETHRYEYRGRDGLPAFFKRRGWHAVFNEKRFLIQHQEVDWDDSGTIWNLVIRKGYGETGPLLYRLPELLKAQPGDIVFIVEGEKDTDNLRALGFIVTCNPDGALKWLDQYSETLAALGVKVVIIHDNDPIGIKHAAKVALSQLEHKVTVGILTLPGLPLHGDISDWLKLPGNDKDAFLALGKDVAAINDESDLRQWKDDHKEKFDRKIDDHGNPVGPPLDTPANIRLSIRKQDCIVGYDEFTHRPMIKGWEDTLGWEELDDHKVRRLRIVSEEVNRLRVNKDRFDEVLMEAAYRNRFHPVRDYLNEVQPTWDKVSRLETWLIDYAGAPDTTLVRTVSKLVLIAAVRRVRQPGSKWDEVVVLESATGTDKSNAIEMLAVNPDWSTDESILGKNTKERMEILDGVWIVEIGELAGMRKAEVEQTKAATSRKRDRARMSYGRRAETHPRQCVFFATTNNLTYLRDMSGNRRFLPIPIQRFELEEFKVIIHQLWAEAATLEASWTGEVRLPSRLWTTAAEEQSLRLIRDGWVELLHEKFGDMNGKISTNDVWRLVGMSESRRNQADAERVNRAMEALGWRMGKFRFGETWAQSGFCRGDAKQREVLIIAKQELHDTSRSYTDIAGNTVKETIREGSSVWRAEYAEPAL